MKGKLLLILCFFYAVFCFSQQKDEYLKDIEKRLLPAPTTASLGQFGGVNVEGSGGISKAINLFKLTSGDIIYSPSINYASVGVQVDDWGGRVGIGWEGDFTAVITREVRSVPDEQATSRSGDLINSISEEEPSTTFSKVSALSLPHPGMDGEYDIYRYNIFGSSGEFIIREGKIIFLKTENNVFIQTGGVDYKFIVTDVSSGIVYRFKEAETVRELDENGYGPYRVNNINTAWFLESIVKNNKTVRFSYQTVTYDQIVDFRDYWEFDFYHTEPSRWATLSHNPYENGVCGDSPPTNSGSRTTKVQRRRISTKILDMVSADLFQVNFGYDARNDIYNEKLLKSIEVFEKKPGGTVGVEPIELQRKVSFIYDETIASTDLPPILLQHLENDNWLYNSLKTRYFLKDLLIDNATSLNERYKFDYINKELLPHRFSFSKDFYGLFNGKNNAGLVPSEAKTELTVPWDKDQFMSQVVFADRHPSTFSTTGLLQRITYPTGGKDSIIYEQNQTKVFKRIEERAIWKDWFTNTEGNSFSGNLFDMYVPYSGTANVQVSCDFDFDAGTMILPVEEYWAKFQLIENGQPKPWPNGNTWIDLQLNKQFSSRYLSFGRYIDLNLEAGNDYTLEVEMYGKNTKLSVSLNYIKDIKEGMVDTLFVGNRVKKQIQIDGQEKKREVSYFYNHVKVNANKLTFDNNSSLHFRDFKKFIGGFSSTCDQSRFRPIYYWLSYTLNDSPVVTPMVYSGTPYKYKFISEMTYVGKDTSFSTTEYDMSTNEYEYLYPDPLFLFNKDVPVPYPHVDNSAWLSGKEIGKLEGVFKNGIGNILQRRQLYYSNTSKPYYQFVASKTYMPNGTTYTPEDYTAYTVKRGTLYDNFTKLDSIVNTTFFEESNVLKEVKSKESYTYYSSDRQLATKNVLASDGKVVKESYKRPVQLIAEGRDPNGMSASLNSFGFWPLVESAVDKNGIFVSRKRTEYIRPSSGIYVLKSIFEKDKIGTESQVVAVNAFDNYGNAVDVTLKNNARICYLYSYKGEYPIAKIENISYADLSTILGSTNIISFSAKIPSDNDIISFLTPLRGRADIQVTSYTYKPLVGMTSKTDARGIKETYTYDGMQRLQAVLDHLNYVNRSFDYHYRSN
ncbi:hypothetical protein [Sphingobacterium siyangense]|uniref:hypothetical protein n=1 Tax=Sphingobacterium siyangense TaxID=459529 RepID=UPI002FDED5C2